MSRKPFVHNFKRRHTPANNSVLRREIKINSISGRVANVARATGGQATQIGEYLYQGIKKGTSKVDGLLSKLSGGIKNIVTSTAGKVAGLVGLGSIITLGFNRMTGIENAQAKLTGLGYSTEKVQGVMKNALASVKGTAFGLGDAVTTSVQLLAAGIQPGEQLEGVLKTVGNTAALAGSDMGEMGQIFGKVAAKGKLQGDTIDQLAERGVPALQWVAEEMGVTAEQAAKSQGYVVAAFGALHLPGEQGVLRLLERDGWTVTALPSPHH